MTKMKMKRVPALRIHKQTGRCYGTFNGETVWFGRKTDPQTQGRFDAHLGAWLARGRKPEQPRPEGLTVRSMVARYLRHLKEVKSDGWQVNCRNMHRHALDALLELHGHEPAVEFGPLKIKAVRAFMASATRSDGEPKRCRKTINERMRIIRNAFEWAVSEEIIPAVNAAGLVTAVKVANATKSGRDSRDVQPVERDVVDATVPYLSAPVAAMVELMWWTGARPSELFGLRPRDIDRSGGVWRVDIARHKTTGKGKRRTLFFGPQAQAVLKPFLLRPEHCPMFSPREALNESNRRRREARATPLYPSHVARYERQRAERPDQNIGEVSIQVLGPNPELDVSGAFRGVDALSPGATNKRWIPKGATSIRVFSAMRWKDVPVTSLGERYQIPTRLR